MKHDECRGCREYSRLSRRSFLGWGGTVLAAAAVPSWVPRVVYAESENSSRDILVSIFLRGGWDGLSVCVPHAEDRYYDLRPGLAVPRPDSGNPGAALDLDGFFGFPPALQPLLEAYQNGDLLMVHACGLLDGTRSHFDAMHQMEVGVVDPPPSLYTGWLGRHLQTTAPTMTDAVLRAVGIGFGLPRSLVGGPDTLPIKEPANFGLMGNPQTEADRLEAMEQMYAAVGDPLQASAASTFATIDLLEAIDFEGYQPAGGAAYPEDEFGQALRSTAALIRAEVGVEAVAIDLGGWDTHDQQGPLDGTMSFRMETLARGLEAFHRDLFGSGSQNVVVVAQSEFGRNAFENASGGTDHGHGTAMLVLGHRVEGGRVLTQWPGLAPGQLYEGQDLDITIDYRDILTEIVTQRLGNPDYQSVFPDPGYTPVAHGVVS